MFFTRFVQKSNFDRRTSGRTRRQCIFIIYNRRNDLWPFHGLHSSAYNNVMGTILYIYVSSKTPRATVVNLRHVAVLFLFKLLYFVKENLKEKPRTTIICLRFFINIALFILYNRIMFLKTSNFFLKEFNTKWIPSRSGCW